MKNIKSKKENLLHKATNHVSSPAEDKKKKEVQESNI